MRNFLERLLQSFLMLSLTKDPENFLMIFLFLFLIINVGLVIVESSESFFVVIINLHEEPKHKVIVFDLISNHAVLDFDIKIVRMNIFPDSNHEIFKVFFSLEHPL